MPRQLAFGLCAVLSVSLVGCGTPDTDPGAKVDAPGYYNGPMQKRQKGPTTGADEKALDGKDATDASKS